MRSDAEDRRICQSVEASPNAKTIAFHRRTGRLVLQKHRDLAHQRLVPWAHLARTSAGSAEADDDGIEWVHEDGPADRDGGDEDELASMPSVVLGSGTRSRMGGSLGGSIAVAGLGDDDEYAEEFEGGDWLEEL